VRLWVVCFQDYEGGSVRYSIYYLTAAERPDGSAAIQEHTATDSQAIADTAMAEAAGKIGNGLFALMVLDGKLVRAVKGVSKK
jgi:hypothetical protein